MNIEGKDKNISDAVDTGYTQHRKLKSRGLGKYEFPHWEKVPPGYYYSKVVHAKFTKTKSGQDAIEVLYEIKDARICYDVASGTLAQDTEIPTYYIKQIYPVDTTYYEDFIDSMAEAMGLYEDEEFEINDVLGITEYNKLSYDKGNIGGFSNRCPFDMNEYVKSRKSV